MLTEGETEALRLIEGETLLLIDLLTEKLGDIEALKLIDGETLGDGLIEGDTEGLSKNLTSIS